jgi:hypothetical protein
MNSLLSLILGVLTFINGKMSSIGLKVVSKITDSDGKLIGIGPDNFKKFLIGFIAVLSVFLVILKTSTKQTEKSVIESYKKDLQSNSGITPRELPKVVDTDSFEFPPDLNVDNGLGVVGPNKVGSGIDDPSKPVPATEVKRLLDKLKNGEELTSDERKALNKAIAENNPAMTPYERGLVKQILDHPEDKAINAVLLKVLKGEASEEEKRMADNLLKMTPKERALAAAASAIADPDKRDEALKQINDSIKDREENAKSTTSSSSKTPGDAAAQLTQSISDRKKIIDQISADLAAAKEETKRIANKIASGQQLTPTEAAAMNKAMTSQATQDKLKKEQDADQKALLGIADGYQNTIMQMVTAAGREMPSSVQMFKISDLPESAAVVDKSAPKSMIKGQNGKKLAKEDELFVQFYRKSLIEFSRARKRLFGTDSNSFEGLELATPAKETNKPEMSALNIFSSSGSALNVRHFTPDMRIPAILDSEIFVSSGGTSNADSQTVLIKTLIDIYDPLTEELVAEAGSTIVGVTGEFNANTGVMKIQMTDVVVGPGKTEKIAFNVGSGDGSMGLKGQVYDTTGKWILGTFVSSFSSGFLSALSRNFVQPLQNSTNLAQAVVMSPTAGGISETADKISQYYAGNLMNAAKIFYCPSRVQVVLYPVISN